MMPLLTARAWVLCCKDLSTQVRPSEKPACYSHSSYQAFFLTSAKVRAGDVHRDLADLRNPTTTVNGAIQLRKVYIPA